MKKNRLLFAAGVVATFFALPANAQLDTSAVYLGGSLGRAHFTDVCPLGAVCKSRDTSFGLFGGLQFSRYLALEGGYRDFGHAVVAGSNIKANALEFDGVANFPLINRFSVLGRIGAYHGRLKGSGLEDKKSGLTFGWGVQYDASPQTGLRVEWQRYARAGGNNFPQTHLDVLGVSALIRFR